ELLEVEGIAAAVLVEDRRVTCVADQLAGLLGAQRPHLDASHRAGAGRPFDGGPEPLAYLPWPYGEREQHSRDGRSVEERAEQLDRCGIRPVDVVEHEHDRLGLRERLKQHADGAVAAVALVLDRGPAPGREA